MGKEGRKHTAQCQIDILWGGGPQTDATATSLVLCPFFDYLLIVIAA
jgi:hypothetical protein